MSKIVCEICGTSYPETSAQCPICGCVKPIDTNASMDINQSTNAYTYVKGGRFSKKNVKKRLAGTPQTFEKPSRVGEGDKAGASKTKYILVITVIAVLLAAVLIGAFFMRDFFGDLFSTSPTTDDSTQAIEISCEDLTVTPDSVILDSLGKEVRLQVGCTPDDTTDTVLFTSDNPEIVTVDNTGKLTAIAEGEAIITVECGTVKVSCTVKCQFSDETEEIPVTEFKLNRKDITFEFMGESWKLYDGTIPAAEITWTTDDAKVATVENGKVVAVGGGKTNVHAEYDGKKYTCAIQCDFEIDPDASDAERLSINTTDVTISVGERFSLVLKDSNGEVVSVEWMSSKPDAVEIAGNRITGKSGGVTCRVYAQYNGLEYSCIVRIKK